MLDSVVTAADQWAAWDTLSGEPLDAFGLIASAEHDENADPICVRVSTLMFRWGRDEDAGAVAALAIAQGLPDTLALDRRAASKSPGRAP